MGKRAPWLPALLVFAGSLFARGGEAQPIGIIELPTPGGTVSGVIRVQGWVLNQNAVDKIELLVDGVVVNRADTSIPRADVLEVFPTYANGPTRNPGFLSAFLARNYANGPHTVSLLVTESGGATFTLGPVDVIVDNSINQAPFGYIDTPGEVGVEGANGSFPVSGWALDDEDVDHIDFLVDGQIVAGAVGRGLPSTAVYGSPRPDVRNSFPDIPNSIFSGFIANIDTTDFINGMHVFSVRVTDNLGASRVIGTRTVQIINNGSNLAPFGRVDFPLDKASLLCSPLTGGSPCAPAPTTPIGICPSPCFPPGPPGVQQFPVSFFRNIVSGWALDVGSRLDKGQVSYVELLYDGNVIANTRTDCVVIAGTFTNCYGVNRPDVARLYAGHVNADNAGFRFQFALGKRTSSGLFEILVPGPLGPICAGFTTAGKHTLAIRAGDEEETVTQFAAMSVDVICDETTNSPAFGFIDRPVSYEFVQGLYPVNGWAHDFEGIRVTGGIEDGVEIDVDGQVLARINNDAPRPDVPAVDPRVTTQFVGFNYTLDTTRLTDGEHDLVVYVVDGALRRSEIGRQKIVVDNNTVTKQ
jgi:hypothetical protein